MVGTSQLLLEFSWTFMIDISTCKNIAIDISNPTSWQSRSVCTANNTPGHQTTILKLFLEFSWTCENSYSLCTSYCWWRTDILHLGPRNEDTWIPIPWIPIISVIRDFFHPQSLIGRVSGTLFRTKLPSVASPKHPNSVSKNHVKHAEPEKPFKLLGCHSSRTFPSTKTNDITVFSRKGKTKK